jgi:hypothetical protein
LDPDLSGLFTAENCIEVLMPSGFYPELTKFFILFHLNQMIYCLGEQRKEFLRTIIAEAQVPPASQRPKPVVPVTMNAATLGLKSMPQRVLTAKEEVGALKHKTTIHRIFNGISSVSRVFYCKKKKLS